jgi:hypothetical protein
MIGLFAFLEFDIQRRGAWFAFELFGLMAFLLILIAIGWAIAVKSRSMAHSEDEPAPEHSLEHYQELFDQDLLDADEFQRIRDKLTARRPPAPPTES